LNRMTLIAAAAAATAFASPALAQEAKGPVGLHVDAVVGFDHAGIDGFHENGVLFGLGAGYDVPVSKTFSLGIDVEGTDSTAKKNGLSADRDLYAGGRASFAVSPRANVYLKGGYTNARIKESGFGGVNLDGFRVGAGGQMLITGKAYVGAEYRYSNYELGVDRHQVALILGTRF